MNSEKPENTTKQHNRKSTVVLLIILAIAGATLLSHIRQEIQKDKARGKTEVAQKQTITNPKQDNPVNTSPNLTSKPPLPNESTKHKKTLGVSSEQVIQGLMVIKEVTKQEDWMEQSHYIGSSFDNFGRERSLEIMGDKENISQAVYNVKAPKDGNLAVETLNKEGLRQLNQMAYNEIMWFLQVFITGPSIGKANEWLNQVLGTANQSSYQPITNEIILDSKKITLIKFPKRASYAINVSITTK